MLKTRFCELFGIEAPIVQAAIWPATSPELVAAVGEAGAIGSIGAVFASGESISTEIAAVRELTARPFIVNHVVPQLNEEAFAATLEARPPAISFALGDPGNLVERAHAAGAKVIHQVHTVAQARQTAELGVDAIIAQGSEAGGQGMAAGVGAMALVPQIVDAVDPIPVLVAGGVADGRGLAAALVLGAHGANVGTRFLAAEEAASDAAWREQILASQSEDTVRFETWDEIFPVAGDRAYHVVPRVLPTPFVERWRSSREATRENAEALRAELADAIRQRAPSQLVPFTGQTAGLIDDVLPAAEIVRRMVDEATEALERASAGRAGVAG
jgi:nitronate monooxygenase/enoyl-[acyl-carrier protein] reductase II